ncbi:TetR/AcrR family transcriptional regulator [Streptomyces sp. NBC_01622]|uniref:TetR/AcrR family transcriptional regulator n=1 Tax=Streptomyces sp. NBC_01622 TaxID=2975903 RepID=UPI00386D759D|nr:TetR/AcrR family transcriptional regulator [Streptomyces sp. NBC_01622]
MDLLEADDGGLSLRAVARRAGVSATAPYRHFADKEALESELAAQGFADLGRRLGAADPQPATPDGFARLAVDYVRFALDRPALFRLMFGTPCTNPEDARAVAAAELGAFVLTHVSQAFPQADAEALATAGWSLVHGLAFLHLDGKLPSANADEVEARVTSAITAILTLRLTG